MPAVPIPASLRVSVVIAIVLVTSAFIITIVVPISNGTEEFAGIVIVWPEPVT